MDIFEFCLYSIFSPFFFFAYRPYPFAVAVILPILPLFYDLFMCCIAREDKMTTISRHSRRRGKEELCLTYLKKHWGTIIK